MVRVVAQHRGALGKGEPMTEHQWQIILMFAAFSLGVSVHAAFIGAVMKRKGFGR